MTLYNNHTFISYLTENVCQIQNEPVNSAEGSIDVYCVNYTTHMNAPQGKCRDFECEAYIAYISDSFAKS